MSSIESKLDLTSEQINRSGPIAKWKYFWLMLLIVSLPMVFPYFTELWQKERYRYFPFVLLSIGYFLHQRWDREFGAPKGWASWLGIAAGFAMVTFGCSVASPWVASIGFVIFATMFLATSRGPMDASLIGLAVPLFLLVRLPLGYDQILVLRLQGITTSLSSVLLDLIAVPHAVANNVIQLTTRELFVAEACSGIQSVFTLMFLSTLLIAANRRPLWLAPLYLMIGMVLAIAANVIRVTSVALADVWFSFDLAEGWTHEILGYAALVSAILFLLSFDQLIVAMLHPVEPQTSEGNRNILVDAWNFMVCRNNNQENGGVSGPIVAIVGQTKERGILLWQAAWARRGLIAISSVLALTSAAQALRLQGPITFGSVSTAAIFLPSPDSFDQFKSDHLDIERHEQHLGGSNPRLGDNADIWFCNVLGEENAQAQFVVSQPYTGWHELCHCYERTNWLLVSREIRGRLTGTTELGDPDPHVDHTGLGPYAIARFKHNDEFAYLLYSGLDEFGDVVKPPPTPGRLGNRLLDNLYEPETVKQLAMLQMLVVTKTKLEPSKLSGIADDFLRMRRTVKEELDASHGNTPETMRNEENQPVSMTETGE